MDADLRFLNLEGLDRTQVNQILFLLHPSNLCPKIEIAKRTSELPSEPLEMDCSDFKVYNNKGSNGDDAVVTKTPKGKQTPNEKRLSLVVPGKNTPAKMPVGKKNATPAKQNSVSKKQATPGKVELQKFMGIGKNQNKKSNKHGSPIPHLTELEQSGPVLAEPGVLKTPSGPFGVGLTKLRSEQQEMLSKTKKFATEQISDISMKQSMAHQQQKPFSSEDISNAVPKQDPFQELLWMNEMDEDTMDEYVDQMRIKSSVRCIRNWNELAVSIAKRTSELPAEPLEMDCSDFKVYNNQATLETMKPDKLGFLTSVCMPKKVRLGVRKIQKKIRQKQNGIGDENKISRCKKDKKNSRKAKMQPRVKGRFVAKEIEEKEKAEKENRPSTKTDESGFFNSSSMSSILFTDLATEKPSQPFFTSPPGGTDSFAGADTLAEEAATAEKAIATKSAINCPKHVTESSESSIKCNTKPRDEDLNSDEINEEELLFEKRVAYKIIEGNQSINKNVWDANDIFQINAQKYGVTSSYDKSRHGYTVPLNKKDTDEYKLKKAQAMKRAREIEKNNSYQERIQLGNGDEEDRFSAVVRPENTSSSKYVLPQKRRNLTGSKRRISRTSLSLVHATGSKPYPASNTSANSLPGQTKQYLHSHSTENQSPSPSFQIPPDSGASSMSLPTVPKDSAKKSLKKGKTFSSLGNTKKSKRARKQLRENGRFAKGKNASVNSKETK